LGHLPQLGRIVAAVAEDSAAARLLHVFVDHAKNLRREYAGRAIVDTCGGERRLVWRCPYVVRPDRHLGTQFPQQHRKAAGAGPDLQTPRRWVLCEKRLHRWHDVRVLLHRDTSVNGRSRHERTSSLASLAANAAQEATVAAK